ncbi:MAG: hypothetical protein M4579_007182 [Chaenotheca gracillima]|nr:MAG: hypothetical protein M4579_007182 [Chaenotheca gracillima]
MIDSRDSVDKVDYAEKVPSILGEAEVELPHGDAAEDSLELGPSPPKEEVQDPDLVTWESDDDPRNPLNWSMKAKWGVTLLMSAFSMITLISSSMIAPALQDISKDLHITSDAQTQLTMSIFVLAYAIGPLIIAPLSETYGRKPVLQIANLLYLIWNITCGFAKSKSLMIAARFLAGMGASAPYGIGGGVLGDCWRPEQRGVSLGIYSFVPLLGPAIGPIIGGYVAEKTTWRWIFWSTSIFDGALQVATVFLFWETHGPTILHKKAKKLRKATGNTRLHTVFERPDQSIFKTLKISLTRPFRLLATHPIIQLISLYSAYNFGTLYIVLSTFPVLWTTRYHESVSSSGLNYIALVIGFTFGSQVGARATDRIWRHVQRSKSEHKVALVPELRVPLMLPGAIFIPAGLFIYGWSAQYHTHWIVPNIGVAIFGAGTQVSTQCMTSYIVDAYPHYTASAIAASAVLRSVTGFGFPLFAPALYAALDYGWGNSLLAFIAISLGIPAPYLLWKFGARLRARCKDLDM